MRRSLAGEVLVGCCRCRCGAGVGQAGRGGAGAGGGVDGGCVGRGARLRVGVAGGVGERLVDEEQQTHAHRPGDQEARLHTQQQGKGVSSWRQTVYVGGCSECETGGG